MRDACARCHALPPADSLPKARWVELLPQMLSMPLPSGVQPLSAEEVDAALDYYARAAPESLPPAPKEPTDDASGRFSTTGFTPRGLAKRRLASAANVSFIRLFDERRLDVLFADMRSRSLFLLAPWAPAKYRHPRVLQRDLNYPCHVSAADVDGDGKQDLLVAALGGLVPGNSEQGSVFVLLQRDGKRFELHEVAKGLGRVCDVRAGDFDGDGDADLVVAAFGWRGPGQLLLLEQTAEMVYSPRQLDPRDGFIHVEVLDLDGDSNLDLVALLSQEHEQVLAYMGDGAGGFTRRVLHRAPHPAWGYSGMQVVDLDADGDPDILLSNGDSLDDDILKPYHGVSWLEQTASGFVHHRLTYLYGCQRAVAGDLDGDGDLDIVAVSFLPQLPPERWSARDIPSVLWLERDGAAWRRRTLERHQCVHPTVALADWNRDGKLDIAVGNTVWVGPDGPTSRADYLTLFTAR